MNLAHRCLLEILKIQKCDMEHSVIADQVFDAEINKATNQRNIYILKNRIKKNKFKINKITDLKNIDLNIPTKINNKISHLLFDVFHWNTVKTKPHAAWKEYFHELYDLIVNDYASDHTCNLILTREIVRYHDTLDTPEKIDYNDKMYLIVSDINDLFNQLKYEQVKISDGLQSIKSTIRENQKIITSLQYEIVEYQKEMRKLEKENDLYFQILRWSVM